MNLRIRQRSAAPRAVFGLEQAGVHPLLARLYAARGVTDPKELDPDLAHLLPLQNLHGAIQAAVLLADAIERQAALCIVADYDCDGATACAVAPATVSYFLSRITARNGTAVSSDKTWRGVAPETCPGVSATSHRSSCCWG